MDTINIHYCQANLSQLLSRVQLGEEIVICNGDTAIARLVPVPTRSSRLASLGQDRGKAIVPEDFNDPLPKDILAAFEGGYRGICGGDTTHK